MKLAIPSEGPNLDAEVGHTLGLSSYLIVWDTESRDFEALPIPKRMGNATGMQVVSLILAKKCNVVLTDWCGPTAEKYFSAYGVEAVTGISGTVADALAGFEREHFKGKRKSPRYRSSRQWKKDRKVAVHAVQSALKQIKNMLPVMIGVVLLLGLFSTFISGKVLSSLFSGSLWWDALLGASVGSVCTGNPVNGYIIGGNMLENGASLIAVTAFICSWVTVGLIQLPAEIAALGWRFAIVRNLACFGLSMVISFVTALILKL